MYETGPRTQVVHGEAHRRGQAEELLRRVVQADSRAQGQLHRQSERGPCQLDASSRRGCVTDRRNPQILEQLKQTCN